MKMETKVLLLDGTYHIIKGHPTDYIQVIDRSGVLQNKSIRTKDGERIELSKIVTMQVNK